MSTAPASLSSLIFDAIEFDAEHVGQYHADPQESSEDIRFSDEVTINCDLATFVCGFDCSGGPIRIAEFDRYLRSIGSCSAGSLTMYARLDRAGISGQSVVAVFSIFIE